MRIDSAPGLAVTDRSSQVSLWIGLLIASVAVYSWKILGLSVPTRVLDHPKVAQLVSLITVALMSALVGIQTFVSDSQVVLDSRVPAVLVALGLTVLRMPFILVVATAAGVAAILRFLLGWA